jgi:uncharacterized protein
MFNPTITQPLQGAVRSSTRTTFIRKTYLHLLLNIVLFSVFSLAIALSQLSKVIYSFAGNGFLWLALLFAFSIAAGILQHTAFSSSSKPVQYTVLLGFIILETVIFSPMMLLGLATGVLLPALGATIALFGILSLSVLVTKTNYDFLGGFLVVGSIISGLVILFGIVFSLPLFSTFFTVAMILLMCGWTLFHTSKITRTYPEDKYIAASIAIFADFVTMLWYVVRLLSGSRR